MTQVSRPNADVANSNWGPTPLYPHVNTVAPNDGSPVACAVPSGGSFDVQLQPLASPGQGPQTLTVRLDEALPGDTLVTFLLLQVTAAGPQSVVGLSVQPTGTFTSYDLTLNAGDIAILAGDYTNLRVRVIASGPGTGSGYGSGAGSRVSGGVATPCCPGGLPAILHVTPLDQTGTCRLGPWTLVWNGNVWAGLDTNNLLWMLTCGPGGSDCTGYLLISDAYGGSGGVVASPNAGCSCSGPNLVFDVTLTGGPAPCSGTVQLVVTQ